MRTRSRNPFSTVTTAGLLLPVDLLTRVIEGDPDLKGLSPKDYHLRSGERLNEAASRAWNECLTAWKTFRKKFAALPASDAGTTLTRDEWLLPLFQELGYGRLQAKKAIEIEGKEYPLSHGWENHVPIHLLSARLPLDRRTPGISGAATRAPYSLLQEQLNRSAQHRWGFVTNGLKLFLLRDNAALARAANVEFDLEAMMDGEHYADFMLMFLLCHQSRVEITEDGKPEDCWLEKWANQADQQGTRAREKLRDGVETAIKSLGAGFLTTKGNNALRERLRTGELSTQDYYRQLLRVVYRLLMLLVAEEKKTENGENLLHPTDTSPEVRDRYARFYSVSRIRSLAYERRGTSHTDLYESLKVLFLKLRESYTPLGIPGMGSFLFSDDSTPDLDDALLANKDLLDAFRNLCYTEDTSGRGSSYRRPVDFGNLGSEELGSVYESLLELHPNIDTDEGPFTLGTAAGNERKTTGSYYTPTSLINCLLDSALDPVVSEAIDVSDPAEAEAALLDLKVCDPACGSGHFLIAAAERMAMHLARLRTGDDQPNTLDVQHAKRDIIGRCIYGVDINPMAVELCKVSLWMEALEPGKPLSFLDHHIQCGNSLLGATPRLLAEGIPDAAFKPIEGDDKKASSEFKKDNKKERKEYESGQGYLFAPHFKLGNLPATISQINAASDHSLEDIAAKQQLYEKLVKGADYLNARLLADTWCAVFVWKKDNSALGKLCPTERDFRKIENSPHSILPHVMSEVQQLADQYQFFHWHLAFPDVFQLPKSGEKAKNKHTGWSGGFDVMIGNPPWDKLTPDSKEFFSQYDERVRFANRASERVLVEELLRDETTANAWTSHRRSRFCEVAFMRGAGFYTLFAEGNLGKGDQNTYRFFLELALRTVSPGGSAAQVVPEGLYNGTNAAAIRKALLDEHCIGRLLGFENARKVWFEGIDSRMKFCIYSTTGTGRAESFRAAFNIRSPQELSSALSGETLVIPTSLVREFSPDSLTLLEFRSQADIDIARKLYGAHPKLGDSTGGEPLHSQSREIDLTNDASILRDGDDGLPVYEGRMVNQYDHRAKGYVSGRARAAVWDEFHFGDATKRIQPQWRIVRNEVPNKNLNRIDRYRIGFARIASPTNRRSFVASLIPPDCIASYTVQTVMYGEEFEWMYIPWLAVANSFTMDFLVRMKVSLDLNFTLLNSLPFPRMIQPDGVVKKLAPLILELCCSSTEMNDYWMSMSSIGLVPSLASNDRPAGTNDLSRRICLSAVIDAIVAREFFNIQHQELDHILGKFPIVEAKDMESFGDFRTKLLVLDAFDSLETESPASIVERHLQSMVTKATK